jgi:hypothetical protein
MDFDALKTAGARATGDLQFGEGLSAAAVRRLACDANVILIVLGANSEPLDVGRAKRFVTEAMRQALIARDRGCVTCGAPPDQCDAHHIVSWIDGGLTSLDNLALQCKPDHRAVHRGEFIIKIISGTVHVSRPTWAEAGPIPARTHNQQQNGDPTPNTAPNAGWAAGSARSAGSAGAGDSSGSAGSPEFPSVWSDPPDLVEDHGERPERLSLEDARARPWRNDAKPLTREAATQLALAPWGDNEDDNPPPARREPSPPAHLALNLGRRPGRTTANPHRRQGRACAGRPGRHTGRRDLSPQRRRRSADPGGIVTRAAPAASPDDKGLGRAPRLSKSGTSGHRVRFPSSNECTQLGDPNAVLNHRLRIAHASARHHGIAEAV